MEWPIRMALRRHALELSLTEFRRVGHDLVHLAHNGLALCAGRAPGDLKNLCSTEMLYHYLNNDFFNRPNRSSQISRTAAAFSAGYRKSASTNICSFILTISLFGRSVT